jgi:hypothetical protein
MGPLVPQLPRAPGAAVAAANRGGQMLRFADRSVCPCPPSPARGAMSGALRRNQTSLGVPIEGR